MKPGKYFTNWKEDDFNCEKCKWSGKGKDLTYGESFEQCHELDCPQCQNSLLVMNYPTIDECETNFNKCGAYLKLMVLRRRLERENKLRFLKSGEDLPDVESEEFVLVWDSPCSDDNVDITIFHNDNIIWRERGGWEIWARYIEILSILQKKYGEKLLDLVPTKRSWPTLGGDKLQAFRFMDKARARLRWGEPVLEEGQEVWRAY